MNSIKTLLVKLPNPLFTIRIFLGLHRKSPFILSLRNGLRFKLRSKMDIWILKETCLDCCYEQPHFAGHDTFRIVDIGAAFGDFSISTAAEYPDSEILAFEPLPESFELLLENLALNRTTNVRPFRLAVGSRKSPVRISSSEKNKPENFSVPDGNVKTDLDSIEVEYISLDQILRSHLDTCDFLKMDCEGAEYDILSNTSADTLKKIKRIALEYHDIDGHRHPELVQLLEQHQFIVRTKRNPVHAHIGYLFARNGTLD